MKNSIFTLIYKAILGWIPLAIGIIAIGGLLYASVQQSMRLSANDSLKETATNLVSVIDSGVTFEQLKSNSPVDVTKDNSFIYVVYDKDKNVVASNVKDIESYILPDGVLDKAKADGKNSVTWQPKDNIRLATYIVPFTSNNEGFVVTARTLYSLENNIQRISKLDLAGIVLALILTLLATIIVTIVNDRWTTDISGKPSSTKTAHVAVQMHTHDDSAPHSHPTKPITKSKPKSAKK